MIPSLPPSRWLRAVVLLVPLYVILHIYLYGPSLDGKTHRVDVGGGSTTATTITDVQTLCKQHGFQPYRPTPGAKRRKVYDLMMVNNELDWLEIRLNTTWHEVDYFVIVESPKTFTGLDKPLTIKDNMDMFKSYQSKIIYHMLEDPPNFHPKSAWDREDLQRNAMFTQVFPRLQGDQAPSVDDVIVVADVDEIARPATLHVLRSCVFPLRLTLRSKFYYYGFQFLHRGSEWQHPQATTYQSTKTILPSNLRNGDGGNFLTRWMDKADLWNSAWHCSSCFRTVAEMLDKMGSFSHTNMNAEVFRDPQRIVSKVREGKDIWDRSRDQFDLVVGNEDVPGFVKADAERFGYLLQRTGPNGGFEDYTPKV